MRCGLLVLAACSAAPSPHAPRSAHARAIDAGVADAAAPEVANVTGCGRPTWAACLAIADHLRDDPTRGYAASAAQIYTSLCEEGDRRRCFEDDTTRDVRARCAADGLVAACRSLGAMYRDGLARCPSDSACAEDLFAMACTAGDDEACTAEAGLRKARTP